MSVNPKFVNIKNNGTINWLISSKYPNPINAAKIAANYVVECIKESKKDPDHTYGPRFEPVLGKLIGML